MLESLRGTTTSKPGTVVPSTLDTDFLRFAAGRGITLVLSSLKSALFFDSGSITLNLREPR